MPGNHQATVVSVVVPCYNAEDWIREALASVRLQDLEGVETIVVDDGSTDASAAIIRAEFPWVRLVATANQGASHARNTGLATARGRFVQFLDADDTLPPRKLAAQVALLDATGADVATADWQYLTRQPDGRFVAGDVVSRAMTGAADVELFTRCWYPIHAYLFRHTIVREVGGFRRSLPIVQDARFALDCALRGARFVHGPGPVVQYRMHSSLQNSRRDPIAFHRDVLTNALEVERWWQDREKLDAEREEALVSVLQYVARASYRRDPTTFEDALGALNRLRPGFRPGTPPALAWLSRLVGYRAAEELAYHYRRFKGLAVPRSRPN